MMILLLFTAWLIHGFTLLRTLYSTTTAASGLSLIGVLALVGVFGGSSIAGMHQLVRLAEKDVR